MYRLTFSALVGHLPHPSRHQDSSVSSFSHHTHSSSPHTHCLAAEPQHFRDHPGGWPPTGLHITTAGLFKPKHFVRHSTRPARLRHQLVLTKSINSRQRLRHKLYSIPPATPLVTGARRSSAVPNHRRSSPRRPTRSHTHRRSWARHIHTTRHQPRSQTHTSSGHPHTWCVHMRANKLMRQHGRRLSPGPRMLTGEARGNGYPILPGDGGAGAAISSQHGWRPLSHVQASPVCKEATCVCVWLPSRWKSIIENYLNQQPLPEHTPTSSPSTSHRSHFQVALGVCAVKESDGRARV